MKAKEEWNVFLSKVRCPYRTRLFTGVLRCRHRNHPDWNPFLYPICEKDKCPILVEIHIGMKK